MGLDRYFHQAELVRVSCALTPRMSTEKKRRFLKYTGCTVDTSLLNIKQVRVGALLKGGADRCIAPSIRDFQQVRRVSASYECAACYRER